MLKKVLGSKNLIFYCVWLVSVILCFWLLYTNRENADLDFESGNPNKASATNLKLTEFEAGRLKSSRISSHSNIPGYPRKSCRCQGQYELKREENRSNTIINETTKKTKPISTCSEEATDFGLGQKIIAYSLYTNKAIDFRLFHDVIDPLFTEIRILFPGWFVRIYSNVTANGPESCRLICKYEFVFWCNIENIPKMGDISSMNPRAWRFLPMGDPTVDIFLSRDLDSQATLRERFAVAEWELSNFTFHSMRDHPGHKVGMLGGMWGAKNYLLGPVRSQELQLKLITASRLKQIKVWDQKIVTKHIYGHYYSIIMAHDSYLCRKFKDNLTLPFPIQRNGGEMIGWRHTGSSSDLQPCPKKCRPFYGKNWKYC